jgi:hypothetical protein
MKAIAQPVPWLVGVGWEYYRRLIMLPIPWTPSRKQLNLFQFNVGLRQETRAVGNARLEPMVKTVYKKVCRRSVCIEVIHELEQFWSEKLLHLHQWRPGCQVHG